MGMGKTKLIKEIIRKKLELQPYMNIYHLDTKKQGDFSAHDGTLIVSEKAPRAFTTQGNKMVWQPLRDDILEYDAFFTDILQAGLPAIVNIDECKNMVWNGRIARGLEILLSQARLPGIDVLGGTQEVAKSPRQMLSQASHIICFRIINAYDVNMMLKYLSMYKEKNLAFLKRFEFMYIQPDVHDTAIKMNSYEELIPLIH